jgi:small subunit ribosomal protein S20
MATKETKKEVKQKRPTALKRDMQAHKRNLRNRSFKASVRTAIRALEASLASTDKQKASDCLIQVHSLMDKGAQKGVYKDNKASRIKSRTCAKFSKAFSEV